MRLKKEKLNYFLFGFCLAIVGRAAADVVNNNVADKNTTELSAGITKNVSSSDVAMWRDTLYVLSSVPSKTGAGYDVVFSNKNGIKQMVRDMKDNVALVDSGDVVVMDEHCNVVKQLARGKQLEKFVKQK